VRAKDATGPTDCLLCLETSLLDTHLHGSCSQFLWQRVSFSAQIAAEKHSDCSDIKGIFMNGGISMEGRILVIEDSATFRKLLIATLRQKNYDVTGADTGSAGIRQAVKQTPDIITLDLSLPDMSGVEALSSLKTDPITCQIPVIVCTASVDSTLRQEVLQKGAAEILTKPVTSADLFSAVDRHLSPGSRNVSPAQSAPSAESGSPKQDESAEKVPDALFEVWSGFSNPDEST
jgi:CheY-like chemotaxis protein